MVTPLNKVLYTAQASCMGGRDGFVKTDDDRLDLKLSSPGTSGKGTNPEQLFAAGYAACFIGAIKAVAGMKKQPLDDAVVVEVEVDLGPNQKGYGIACRLVVKIPKMERHEAEVLVAEAHRVCPYSNATRGNIPVELTIAEPPPLLNDAEQKELDSK